MNGNTQFVYNDAAIRDGEEEGFEIVFSCMGKLTDRDALREVKARIDRSPMAWINTDRKEWVVNFDVAKETIEPLDKLYWLSGKAHVSPVIDVEETAYSGDVKTTVKLQFLKEDVIQMHNNKIFLSHKGKNKPLVREYNAILTELGFNTWLDEDAMNAGALLDRALQDGMNNSCAAVFFVTPDYKDEGYLSAEIDYAVAEKRKKGDRFQIITIVLENEKHEKSEVPMLLQRFVWKECGSDLRAVHEIIKALPVSVGEINWRN